MSESSSFLSDNHQAAIPFWRDVKILRWIFQIAILVIVIVMGIILISNLRRNLAKVNLDPFDFTFLTRPAGFTISEGPPFSQQSSFLTAYGVAVINSLKAIGIGIVTATILGVIVGVSRLSANWLVRNIALIFIEIMQNTPLLVQLFFWFVLIKSLPAQKPDEIIALPAAGTEILGIKIPTLMYMSQRAAALPGMTVFSAGRFWSILVLGIVVGVGAGWLRVYFREREGRPPTGQFWIGLGAFSVATFGLWMATGSIPFKITIPSLVGNDAGTIFQYENGWILSNNFQALLLGLVLYTAAFIAEVVRSGIQSVQKGQIEAATALGLTPNQRLRLVIMPQAMRVIIPPLINQYLNLAKNSSLAIAVAYPDLFNISQTIGNQSGQNVQLIFMVMATYLVMSLSISSVMNFANQRMQIKER